MPFFLLDRLDRFKSRGDQAMHPINHLFEDIYRNYWGILPAFDRPERRHSTGPGIRNREWLARRERPQD